MLPKERRIQKKYFPYILKTSKKRNSTHISLYIADMTEDKAGESQFSFSISKKISKKATDRNKIRRRGYSIIKKHIARVPKNKFFFFVFRGGAEKLDFSSLEKEITQLISDFFI